MIEKFLTRNEYSRPGRPLRGVSAIILHWTGSPDQGPDEVWNFFETDCPKTKHYSSAHYIIGQEGTVIHAIPDAEMAYHVGSSQNDPLSGKIYTDRAREIFGKYASNPDQLSPNQVSIGIELCPTDAAGSFSEKTLVAARDLVKTLLARYGLPKSRVETHHAIVGWKPCPLIWTNHPELFEKFKGIL